MKYLSYFLKQFTEIFYNLKFRLSIIAILSTGIMISYTLAQDVPEPSPEVCFHLTARPWEPLDISRDRYLDAIEGICRVAVRHQDENGAIIDPYLHREHRYSTPYYAFAVGALLEAGRATDLRNSGVRAMEHATRSFAGGSQGIPDAHGEFFIAPLTGGSDEQHFIGVNGQVKLSADSEQIRSTYGWLQPVRYETPDSALLIFVYPRGGDDPAASKVKASFRHTAHGFESVLGDVRDRLYVGRTAAGGFGNEIDLDGDGEQDLQFDTPCNFIVQLEDGTMKAVEADRTVTMTYQQQQIALRPYTPWSPE
ncbi:MAG TPA: hypothetical protein VKA68_03020 [bacterium]|nr:hypothetical protein [bacterium]